MGTVTKVKSSYTQGDLMSRDKLIIEYLSLVKYVVGKVMVYLPLFVDREDLIEYGILGLIEAAEKYDSKKETKFGTYAITRIRGAILDYLRSQDWLPRSVRDKATMVRDTYISLEQKLNRPPRSDEIAAVLKINPAEWDKLLAEISFSTFLSLEEYNQKSEDNSREDRNQQIKDPKVKDPLSCLETQEEKTLLANAIAELPKRERLVITLYYYEDLMLKEISQLIGISESRVSQLHHRALFLLRARMSRISVNAC
ncbi:MAG: FliA/WhiG family RNA polymerase sigma factor [Candidatus Brocadiaceae bacterium]|uniref:sigma-70 family RNA polymerase sigma factor n=1 Tax=Candidatus Wunengus sp. YC61 TaxID=3367698 RepID=UPI002719A5BC|nr:FliA/WhiG family RNA polymerase sigma factor [Candidatus Brocadiaceae bacterium]